MSQQLSSIQKWMQHMLLNPELDHHNGIQVAQIFRGTGKMSARQHLATYRRSYILRLRGCMSAQFSALEYALGNELFNAFVDQYLTDHPSTSYTLSDLGSNFADFMEKTRPDRDQPVQEDWPDFMIELINFEYTINRLFDLQTPAKEKPASLQTKDSQLRLNPVLELKRYNFPISWFYRSFKNGKEPQLPLPYATRTVVIRKNLQIGFVDLSEEQFNFLSRVLQGSRIEDIAQQTDFKQQWSRWRDFWIKTGIFLQK